MFVIPSHGRLKKLRELLDSFGTEDLRLPVMVVVCDRDPSYPDYLKATWPRSWQVHVANGDYTYCGEKMNWAFKRLPDARYYGHLCDDVLIETQNKLQTLVEAAQDWWIAYPNDGLYHGDLTCFPVCGGKLVRTWGWWAHPMFKHNCLDSVIDDIGRTLGLLRYFKEIRYIVKHPMLNTAPWDDTYRRVEEINRQAGYLYDTKWKDTPERAAFLKNVKRQVEEGLELAA